MLRHVLVTVCMQQVENSCTFMVETVKLEHVSGEFTYSRIPQGSRTRHRPEAEWRPCKADGSR